ncbi:hypothetical protein M9H77_12876 [Catharanthus roseus]|uniref:Uncharacterized protein n=1 Tax=Catharanthus roseus TaxID=4058 RepID=A0ACC0BIQ4_CATRO|nr:hypothetical protein M9H77_12876 [Catharanthus roseus]
MSGRNSDIQNVVQDIEALRDRVDAQEVVVRTLEMINRFDALRVNANRNRNDEGQRPRDQLAQGSVADVPIAANVQSQVASYNSSDKEEDLILAEDQNRLARRGSGRLYKVDREDDLRESEVHQAVKSVTEAKNLAIKAELMIRNRGGSRFKGSGRMYGNDNFRRSNSDEDASRNFADRSKTAQGWNQGTERKEDKGPGKKVAESKKGHKVATNPYAKPILGKCFRCRQTSHGSNECPTRKPINVVERDEEETFCSKFKDSHLEFLVEHFTLR